MKTIGEYLRSIRIAQDVSLEELSTATKIRIDYLESIESDNFSKLPSAAFVKGFIRSYALAFEQDPEKALAIFRRDFDQNNQGKVVPRGLAQPINTGEGFWSPRTTSFVFGGFLLLLVVGYMLNQVLTLVSAPKIVVESPLEQQVFLQQEVSVIGKTHSDASVFINDQSVILDSDGRFSTTVQLEPGTQQITIEARSRDGKVSQETRTITVESPLE